MLKIVRIEPPWEDEAADNEPRTVYLQGELQNVEVFDEIAGYMVTKIQTGQHDNHPATQFTLADACGDREVGRFILRNDAYHDALLEWTRYFPQPLGGDGEACLEDFLYEAHNLEDIPAGFHFVPARKIDVGDVCRDEMTGYSTEETVVGVRYGTTPPEAGGANGKPGLGGVVVGQPMVEFQFKFSDGTLSGWTDYGLDHQICRREA